MISFIGNIFPLYFKFSVMQFLSSLSFFLEPESLSPSLECNRTILVHCNLCIPSSNNVPALASQVAETTGMHHCAWLTLVFSVEMGFPHVVQPGVELLDSRNSPTSASQSIGITGLSHCTRPKRLFLYYLPCRTGQRKIRVYNTSYQ